MTIIYHAFSSGFWMKCSFQQRMGEKTLSSNVGIHRFYCVSKWFPTAMINWKKNKKATRCKRETGCWKAGRPFRPNRTLVDNPAMSAKAWLIGYRNFMVIGSATTALPLASSCWWKQLLTERFLLIPPAWECECDITETVQQVFDDVRSFFFAFNNFPVRRVVMESLLRTNILNLLPKFKLD